MTSARRCRLPDISRTRDTTTGTSRERRVGVEIELSGLGYDELVTLCAQLLEGEPRLTSRYVTSLKTALGEFTVELDSDPVKELDLQDERLPESIRELGGHAMTVIDAAAEKLVPLEIVSPPIPLSRLEQIETLCDSLREAGALGSREAVYYAFGLQLNPELPDLDPATLVRYLQGFAALYDWLKARHQLDISRKLTSYIEPWDSQYTDRLVAKDYSPDMARLMSDYLTANPSRNHALDLLPLFAHLDSDLLARHVRDSRVKPRPTLHYRLPDCDIDNPRWHFSQVWNDWVVLEQLVSRPDDLQALLERFRASRKLSFHNLTHSWTDDCQQWLRSKGYI
ncbi:amidoligase family protein [Marinobacter sp.]|uniref:amidoligase family protein n=1 Tax=Marinobacter sp. TaxID=50741 RepID=UPI0019AFCF0C|nr:amidoligase family protein [Marinobacter sp.]MBD3656494.1 amidoligase family protein [Marinobacter sp.]